MLCSFKLTVPKERVSIFRLSYRFEKFKVQNKSNFYQKSGTNCAMFFEKIVIFLKKIRYR